MTGLLATSSQALLDGVHKTPVQAATEAHIRQYVKARKRVCNEPGVASFMTCDMGSGIKVSVAIDKDRFGSGKNNYETTITVGGQNAKFQSQDTKYHKHAACQQFLIERAPQV